MGINWFWIVVAFRARDGRGRPSSILETSPSVADLTQATASPDLLSKRAPLDRPRDAKKFGVNRSASACWP